MYKKLISCILLLLLTVTVITVDGGAAADDFSIKHILFIGNSILMGMEKYSPEPFGMAASSPEEDYYALVMQQLREQYPDIISDRIQGNVLEAATLSNIRKEIFFADLDKKLSPDVDTVIIQLGDNVNKPERLEAFQVNAAELIRHIREKTNQDVRIIWMAAWFNSKTVLPVILDACDQEGAEFVDISDIWKTAHVGDEITLSDGSRYVITSKGEATHPSSEGMRIIADRLVAALQQ